MRGEIRFYWGMHIFRSSLSAWVAIAIWCGVPVASAAVSSPKVVSAVEPEHPPALFERGLGGSAKVTISIAADGTVSDVAVAEASDPAFGEAAVAAAKQWKFEPATRDGEPIAIKVSQRFDFAPSIERMLSFLAGRPVFFPEPENVIPAEKLRRSPVMIKNPSRPVYPTRFAGSGEEVGVPIEFIINLEGMPINPQVAGTAEGEEIDVNFQLAALRAILSARWEPYVQKGEPVYVSASMTIWVREHNDEIPTTPAATPLLE